MGGFSSFRVHLEELVRARTPLFYIGSIEIKRCLEELRRCEKIGTCASARKDGRLVGILGCGSSGVMGNHSFQ